MESKFFRRVVNQPPVRIGKFVLKAFAGRQQYRPGIRPFRRFCAGIIICILFCDDIVLWCGIYKVWGIYKRPIKPMPHAEFYTYMRINNPEKIQIVE
jgi:hypothetical protein